MLIMLVLEKDIKLTKLRIRDITWLSHLFLNIHVNMYFVSHPQ